MGKFRQKRWCLLLFTLIFIISLFHMLEILFYPSNLNIIKGENKNLNISFPFSLDKSDGNIVDTIYSEGSSGLKNSLTLNGVDKGSTELKVKFLGLIPVRNYNVNVIDRPMVVPGGNAVGVRMNTKGVLIVAVTEVIDIEGNRISPARNAGLKVGDSLIEINGERIETAEQVVKLLNDNEEKELELLILRNNNVIKTKALPVQCLQDNAYRLGIWVRDKTSGIGTMTYYDEKNNSFGALGHGITDVDTGELLTVDKGYIMNAKISDIEQGKKGTPGEIKGVFYKTDDVLGEISMNTDYGIYGHLTEDIYEIKSKERIPIGFKEEVEIGKAYILSTLEDEKIEKFEIEIQKAEIQDSPSQKSMVIKVTDKQLLEKTGGIVQGMSGSPIIQNGKLIGAVTHVFINDPTKGYGIYIEWMMNNSGKL